MQPRARHPGEVLELFLREAEVSQNRLARAMGVPPRRVNEILHGKRGISADTAIALAELFGIEEGFWMRLQDAWDLEKARARRAARPRKARPDRGLISLDYLVEVAPGEWQDGFHDWLEHHDDCLKRLRRGTRIVDEHVDPLDRVREMFRKGV
jgi:antitoxin HigA-1